MIERSKITDEGDERLRAGSPQSRLHRILAV